MFTRANHEDQMFLAETKFQVYFSLSPFFCLSILLLLLKQVFANHTLNFVLRSEIGSSVVTTFLRFSEVPRDPGSQDRSFLRLRLSMKSTVKSRPLKSLWNDEGWSHVKIGRLKDAAEFKRISITNDYTREEREEIRRWIMLANEKNTKEDTTGYTWRGEEHRR